MKELPIIFNAEMVRAILDNRKFQTRRRTGRVCGLDDIEILYQFNGMSPLECLWKVKFPQYRRTMQHSELLSICSYGQVGDVLWVQEEFQAHYNENADPALDGRRVHIEYAADTYRADDFIWWPPEGMARGASRITLEIIDVRIEQLSPISYEDARAEGMTGDDPVKEFYGLWESIYGEGTVEENPYVWVIEFRRVEEMK